SKDGSPITAATAGRLPRTTKQSLARQYRARKGQQMRNNHESRIEKCRTENQERPMWICSKIYEQQKASRQLGYKDCRNKYRDNTRNFRAGISSKRDDC